MYQSQLDTERQGVLRNMWLTSARLSTAAALTISLNMIIKVRSSRLKSSSEKLKMYLCVSFNTCHNALQCFQVWMDQTADNHIFKFLKNKLSRFVLHSYVFLSRISCHGKYLRRSANQSECLRDSTDFETQLYLCNEAFKVWALTPFNSSQTSYKIPCIHKSNFEAETCQNISLENTFVGTNNFDIPPSVARLANLPPTLLVLRLACLPPLRPPCHLRPPP